MRWIFAAIGFLYLRFWGAIAGYFLGKLLEDSLAQRRGGRTRPQAQLRIDILQDFLTLAMAVARADGQLDRREVRTIRQFFIHSMGFSGPAQDWLKDALKSESKHPGDWNLAAQRLRQSLSQLDLSVLMRALIHIAQADGHIDESERRMLHDIAQQWGMLGPQYEAWQQPASTQKDRAWALNILGLSEPAGRDEIDRAYKQLVREKHPDRFAHLGDEFQKEAHEQFVEIQQAYQMLKSS